MGFIIEARHSLKPRLSYSEALYGWSSFSVFSSIQIKPDLRTLKLEFQKKVYWLHWMLKIWVSNPLMWALQVYSIAYWPLLSHVHISVGIFNAFSLKIVFNNISWSLWPVYLQHRLRTSSTSPEYKSIPFHISTTSFCHLSDSHESQF